MGDMPPNRRNFLKLSVYATALGLLNGCHSASYQMLGQGRQKNRPIRKNLRVLSFNIANARGNNDYLFNPPRKETVIYNLDWIADLIRHYDIDVACMNEVDFNSIRTHGIDMPGYIARALDYGHIIREKMFAFPSILETGNAVVSRLPLRLNEYRQYGQGFVSRARHIFKSFVDFYVRLDDSGRTLNLVLTHLDHHNENIRCAEVDILREHLKWKNHPFVLMGDLNATPESKCFKRLVADNLVGNPDLGIPTYPPDNPYKAIDHILVSPGLKIENYHTVSMEASDHLPIMADIILD